jgi:Arc/MetJ-type ribon-helix-helix transcriptional regulator
MSAFSDIVHVRVTDEQREDLAHIIKVRRTTKSDFVRQAVDRAIEEELHKITQERITRRTNSPMPRPRRRLALPSEAA